MKKRENVVHRLKALPEYFLNVCAGRKCFEIRVDDRDIQPGDTVILLEWTKEIGYTGAMSRPLRVTYVLRNVPQYGLAEGYCIFCWDN